MVLYGGKITKILSLSKPWVGPCSSTPDEFVLMDPLKIWWDWTSAFTEQILFLQYQLSTTESYRTRVLLHCKHKVEKTTVSTCMLLSNKAPGTSEHALASLAFHDQSSHFKENHVTARRIFCYDKKNILLNYETLPTILGLLLSLLSCTELCGLVTLLQNNRPTLQTERNVSLPVPIVAWSLVWPLGKTTRSHTVWFQAGITNCKRTVLLNEIKLWSVYTVCDTHIMAIFLSPDHPPHSNATRIRGISSAFLQLSIPHDNLVRRNPTPKACSHPLLSHQPDHSTTSKLILLSVSLFTWMQSSETRRP